MTLFVLAQAVLLGYTAVVRSWFLLAVGEIALLSLAAAAVVLRRYLELRRELAQAVRTAERQRLADDVHDLVGHDLSLIALQAGLLQLRAPAELADVAGEVRARAEQAVVALHDCIRLLGDERDPPPDSEALIAEFRAAGGEIKTTSSRDGETPVPARLTAATVLREALSNAARHAPGHAVSVDLRPDGLTVLTHGVTGARAEGHGLGSARRRVEAVGGSLAVGVTARGHEVVAVIPREPVVVDPPAPARPARSLARLFAVPAVGVLAVVLGFYTVASHGRTVEPSTKATLVVGMPVSSAALPAHTAFVRLLPAPPHPAGWRCRAYTDGNFPLAMATTEVCSDATRIMRITDLAARRPW